MINDNFNIILGRVRKFSEYSTSVVTSVLEKIKADLIKSTPKCKLPQHTHTNTRTYIHTQTYAHTHTHEHTHIHTYTKFKSRCADHVT